MAAVGAYAYPLLLATHEIGAALAAGCTVVLVLSPRTPARAAPLRPERGPGLRLPDPPAGPAIPVDEFVDVSRAAYAELVVGVPREEKTRRGAGDLPGAEPDEAVAPANGTRYGPHAYLFSGNRDAALEMAGELRAGKVSVNGEGGFWPDVPMGGFGISGVGRELGERGIREFLEPQRVQWQ